MSDAARRRKRNRAETRFRWYGRAALGLAFLALASLLGAIVAQGYSAFVQTRITLPITFDRAVIDPYGLIKRTGKLPPRVDTAALISAALPARFSGLSEIGRREALRLLSGNAQHVLRRELESHPQWLGTTQTIALPADDKVDQWRKGRNGEAGEAASAFTLRQRQWLEDLRRQGALTLDFNTALFSQGDSRDPESAGFLGSVVGSLFMLAVCLGLAFPLGVLTAVFLEEFAPKNRKWGRWTGWIEVNINNLAAVPSIVYGLLGLSLYIQFLGLPRSSALVGGLTPGLLIAPVIIIASRAALRSVPPSIRDGARALGATPLQVVLHQVLPLSLPGMMTGTILGIARALGETAPLLMIGMVAFVADIPARFTDPATTMPVQVFLWADSPEPAFAERTAAGILLLLAMLVLLNSLAIWIRRKFEVRW